MSADSLLSNWLNRFFTAYYDHRPVNATFIGVHDRDHLLPDYSEHGAGDAVAEMQNLLHASSHLEPVALSPIERIDLHLARGFLRIQRWEYESDHFHRGNPSLYTGEAVFGVLALFLTAFAPLRARIAAATARLEAVPAFLAQGRANVRRAPAAWTERAIRECEGALAFLTERVDVLLAENRIDAPRFKAAADSAAAAFSDHHTHRTVYAGGSGGLLRRPGGYGTCSGVE